eukprot:149667-Chlamydomonas_euryale.AAC.3
MSDNRRCGSLGGAATPQTPSLPLGAFCQVGEAAPARALPDPGRLRGAPAEAPGESRLGTPPVARLVLGSSRFAIARAAMPFMSCSAKCRHR